jgi:hypothetical protein
MLSSKPSDIHSVLKPVFNVLRIIGIVPYILKNDNDLQNVTSSMFSLLYSVTIVSTLLLCQILGIWEFSKLFSFSSLYYMVDVIKVTAINISGAMMLFCCFFYKKRINSIIYNFSRFDETFQHMFYSYNKSSFFTVSQICIFFIVDLSSFIISILFTEFADVIFAACAAHSSLFIIQILDLKFVAFVYLLGQRFSILNISARKIFSDDRPVTSLRHFTHYHDFLCDILELVNDTYAPQTLLIVTFKFIALTSYCYFGILRILNINSHGYIRGSLTRECVMYGWSCWNVSTLVFMFWVCNSTSREVRVHMSHFEIFVYDG